MKDFLGYNREVRPNGQLVSSQYATISSGSGKMSLVQQVNASYTQTVTPRFEAGSPTLFWQTGAPSGQIQLGRLVGKNGFLAMDTAEDTCGSVQSMTIAFDGQGGCANAQISIGESIKFAGAVVANIGISYSVSNLDVSETLTLQVASMSKG